MPAPRSYEFRHALKTLGVETQFVVYEHEGRMFAKPEHQRTWWTGRSGGLTRS